MEEPRVVAEKSEELGHTRFIKLYDLAYEDGAHYFVASRHDRADLRALMGSEERARALPDAVSCCLILAPDGEDPRLVLFWEYRYPTGQYVLSIPSGLVDAADIVASDSFQFRGGYRAAKELLDREQKSDGIIAFNDFLAMGALQAVEEAGLKAGTDIAVVGFDNILFSSLPSIDLTTITPSNTELGNTAMQIICESYEIRDKKQINTLLEPHIIYRSTYRADEAIPEI